MKKIYFLAASLMLSAGAMAQLQNGGFETWAPGVAPMTTDPHPGNWQSILIHNAGLDGAIDNDLSAFGYTITIGGTAYPTVMPTTEETTGSAEGTNHISLQTFTATTTSSTIFAASAQQFVQTNQKYPGVIFNYKSNITANDTALVYVVATGPSGGFGADHIIGVGNYFITSNQASWVLDTAAITYYYSDAIDTIEIDFISSAGAMFTNYTAPAQDGSKIYIDGVSLQALPTYADTASNIMLADISNNHNGTDLQVKFNKAANEATVSEYRIFAVEHGVSASESALSSIPGGMDLYVSVTPNGSATYTTTFTATSKVLTTGAPYTMVEDSLMDIYILSVADGTNATANSSVGSSADSIRLLSTSGIVKNQLANNEIRVYPNPASSQVNFVFENSNMASAIQVYNMTGQMMKTIEVSSMTTLSLSNFDSGMYFYHIVGKDGAVIKTDKFQVIK